MKVVNLCMSISHPTVSKLEEYVSISYVSKCLLFEYFIKF